MPRKSTSLLRASALISVLALGACAVAPPAGPRVMALPGAGKDFGTFQNEDAMCRQFAFERNGGTAGAQAATNNATGTALLGTAVGAGLGMALGSLSGQMGAGAVVGGTMGALVGGSAATSGAAQAGGDLQQAYDAAYIQCMYSNGNSVQNPPGGYRSGVQGTGGYAPVAVYGGPAIVVGTGWGWRHRPRYWRY